MSCTNQLINLSPHCCNSSNEAISRKLLVDYIIMKIIEKYTLFIFRKSDKTFYLDFI